ncbi:Tyrosine kinase receptor Cad96Ca-like protein, partial [Leptotrombidium deliense]
KSANATIVSTVPSPTTNSSNKVTESGRKDGDRVNIQPNGRDENVRRESEANDRDGRRLDVITAFLPLLAAVAFAPIVAIVFYILHRRCNRDSGRNLIKSLSQKANILTTLETSINSHVTGNDYNRDFLSVKPISNLNATDFGAVTKSKENCKWEFPRHHLRFIGILGEGCFGQVWKCEATRICNSEEPQIVAVKTLKENANEKERKDLLTELEIMKILDPHPNVVTLMGCCTEQEPIFLIMDYVPFGKLQTYLRESRSEMQYGNLRGTLSARDLTSFAYQVAKGMEYIASKGIIHRDLAARNILIGNNKTCKIGDFGFARDVVASHVYERKSEGRLPIRWMAIESLYDNVFTTKSDVWSFGILMWEIVTLGSTPYPGLPAEQVMKKVCEGYRLEKPDHCKREMYNIMFYCWDADANERPSFTELVEMLDKLLISENDYIELDRFPDHCYYNIITSLPGERL